MAVAPMYNRFKLTWMNHARSVYELPDLLVIFPFCSRTWWFTRRYMLSIGVYGTHKCLYFDIHI